MKCKEMFQHRGVILQRYLDADGELELHALYAIQAFVNELQHPAGECRHRSSRKPCSLSFVLNFRLFSGSLVLKLLVHVAGVLRSIFENLYDEDIVAEEAFFAWEASTDPNESAGKGVAVQSVAHFLVWLRDDESNENATNATNAAS